MRISWLTNIGRERVRNEDSCFAVSDGKKALLVVADGMGGHKAGNVASSLAVATAENFWQNIDGRELPDREKTRQMVKDFIYEANGLILAEAAGSSTRKGMGTTITAVLLSGRQIIIGHVGDSRAYLINNNKIRLLTKDHSLIEQLIASGEIKPEDAINHPQRHILTRALGVERNPEVDILEMEVDKGAAILLCTDGLTNLVNDQEILAVSTTVSEPQLLAEKLIEMANDRGGHDNITVVIASGIGGPKD
ncbi:MAG: Stp1/IreP family PP2C-type Ser/Thr phosphatase [Bacillota bacterium]|nr:Stp1/IreP family PP2C-type Ser/Thr phosphatase [Bacillota bacterium]